jgi:integrase
MALTVKRIAKATKPGRYGDGHGLYLQVLSPTNRSWLLRYERDGRERWMGLGPLHTINLLEARERARRARQQLLDGIDPLEARAADKAARALLEARAMTFEEAARQYYAAHEATWSNRKHRQQFQNTMRDYVLPKIGKLAVAAVDTGQVLRVIEPLWQQKPATANKTRGRVERVLDWAAVRGYRAGDNPARWRGHLDQVLPAPGKVAKPVGHAALPHAELPGFMAKLAKVKGVAGRALAFTILTAARTGETVGATRSEIDFAAKTWTIPASRMKGGREHKVPLSDAALALLQSLPIEEGNPHVFIGSMTASRISHAAMLRALKRLGIPNISVHGFRSTFSTWAHEATPFPNHVIELSLAHTVGNAVERAYRRSDLFEKRRKLMEQWARFCTTKPAQAAQVVTLRGQR